MARIQMFFGVVAIVMFFRFLTLTRPLFLEDRMLAADAANSAPPCTAGGSFDVQRFDRRLKR